MPQPCLERIPSDGQATAQQAQVIAARDCAHDEMTVVLLTKLVAFQIAARYSE